MLIRRFDNKFMAYHATCSIHFSIVPFGETGRSCIRIFSPALVLGMTYSATFSPFERALRTLTSLKISLVTKLTIKEGGKVVAIIK